MAALCNAPALVPFYILWISLIWGTCLVAFFAGQGPKASGKYVPSFMPPSLAAAVNRDGGSTASSSGFSSARNGVRQAQGAGFLRWTSNACAFAAWDVVKTKYSLGHGVQYCWLTWGLFITYLPA